MVCTHATETHHHGFQRDSTRNTHRQDLRPPPTNPSGNHQQQRPYPPQFPTPPVPQAMNPG